MIDKESIMGGIGGQMAQSQGWQVARNLRSGWETERCGDSLFGKTTGGMIAAERRGRTSSSPLSSSLLRVVAVAICLVLAFHWRTMIVLVDDGPRRQLFPLPGPPSSKRVDGADPPARRRAKEPYILSPVCGGCYRAYRDRVPCHTIVQRWMKRSNGTLLEAMRHVGRDERACSACDPDTCHRLDGNRNGEGVGDGGGRRLFKYWRFDRIFPRGAPATGISLPSIPGRLRIPPSRYGSIEAYIRRLYADPDPKNTSDSFLVEYNPSLVPIPVEMRECLPWNARYLASLRVTPVNRCFSQRLTDALPEDVKQTMHSVSHLGLALLDADLRVIPGYDVVIDLDVQMEWKRWKWMGEPALSDYRLATMNGQIYLYVNSDVVIVSKLRLRAKGFGGDPGKDEGGQEYRLRNLHGGDNLEVTLMHQFNSIWRSEERTGAKWSNVDKNFALFSLPDLGNPDASYVEMTVYPEHVVRRILPDEFEQLKRDKWIRGRVRRNFRMDPAVQRRVRGVGNATSSTASLLPSFFTADEHWFPGGTDPFKEFAHGGACCVSLALERLAAPPRLQLDGADRLLVGVGHNVVPYYSKRKLPENERMLVKDTSYVSFFYAFDPRPPFELVARSGRFCLGFASASDGGMPNPRSVLTRTRPLEQHNETFDCPMIHFVSTIVEKVDDPSTVIIGYGINDCTARLVEVPKKEIADLLFQSADRVLQR